MEERTKPDWLGARGSIDEAVFCEEFQRKHYIVFEDGAFFSLDGRMEEQQVKQLIYRDLRPYVRCSIGSKAESIFTTLRLEAAQSCMEQSPGELLYTIPVANGTYRLDTGFVPAKHMTRYRLPVNYNPDAPKPERWLKFLEELLHEEDIPTLQEFMGYCLIPTTIAQKMLLITGKGGEGKSRIGVVLKALLGTNMNIGSIAKVEKSPFARADLQHTLVMVDDDLKLEAMDQTNHLKSIITAELPMDLERKGIQSYQGKLHVRFLAFGNGSLQALHDRSHGFFRRQIILSTRERPRDRVDDPYLGMALVAEKEGILLWCIQGLERLSLNDYKFTVSRRARENLLQSMLTGNNILEFLRSDGYIRFDPESSVTSRQLYESYQSWCSDNALRPISSGSFWGYLGQNCETYGFSACKNVPVGNGKRVRGFRGIRLCHSY